MSGSDSFLRDSENKRLKLSSIVDEVRLIKSDAEVEVMRKGGKITGRAFVEVKFY